MSNIHNTNQAQAQCNCNHSSQIQMTTNEISEVSQLFRRIQLLRALQQGQYRQAVKIATSMNQQLTSPATNNAIKKLILMKPTLQELTTQNNQDQSAHDSECDIIGDDDSDVAISSNSSSSNEAQNESEKQLQQQQSQSNCTDGNYVNFSNVLEQNTYSIHVKPALSTIQRKLFTTKVSSTPIQYNHSSNKTVNCKANKTQSQKLDAVNAKMCRLAVVRKHRQCK